MFIASAAQFKQLLLHNSSKDCSQQPSPEAADLPHEQTGSSIAPHSLTLLDIGAGDGHVTACLEATGLFRTILTTEASSVMCWRLRQRGYISINSVDIANCPELSGKRFDVVALLNVLDRCSKPLTLLRQIREQFLELRSGKLLLAVVLPFEPFVENGSAQEEPEEFISLKGTTWEQWVESLVKEVLIPCGYRVAAFTRVPYLCEGDLYHSYYSLDDVLFVLEQADEAPEGPSGDQRQL